MLNINRPCRRVLTTLRLIIFPSALLISGCSTSTPSLAQVQQQPLLTRADAEKLLTYSLDRGPVLPPRNNDSMELMDIKFGVNGFIAHFKCDGKVEEYNVVYNGYKNYNLSAANHLWGLGSNVLYYAPEFTWLNDRAAADDYVHAFYSLKTLSSQGPTL